MLQDIRWSHLAGRALEPHGSPHAQGWPSEVAALGKGWGVENGPFGRGGLMKCCP